MANQHKRRARQFTRLTSLRPYDLVHTLYCLQRSQTLRATVLGREKGKSDLIKIVCTPTLNRIHSLSSLVSLSPPKKHFDTVVFFKKGKFFELYEMDADIGHKEFDLKMTDRVNMRMVGVPESSFNDWAAKFLAKGYKITKVEQKESSKDLKERRGKGIKTKKEDVIQRGVERILTPATLTDPSLLQDKNSTYLLAIKEEPSSKTSSFGLSSNGCVIGICFVDTAVGEVFRSF